MLKKLIEINKCVNNVYKGNCDMTEKQESYFWTEGYFMAAPNYWQQQLFAAKRVKNSFTAELIPQTNSLTYQKCISHNQ